MPFLTGNETASLIGRCFVIPNDDYFIAAVMGALADLTRENNWQQFGTMTPARAAELAIDVVRSVQEQETVSTVLKGAIVKRTGVQTFSSSLSFVSVQWQTAAYENGEFWDAGQPSRITIPESGVYQVSANVEFLANATGTRRAALFLNGDVSPFWQLGFNASAYPTTGNMHVLTMSQPFQLAAGDYLELKAQQNSGGNLQMDEDRSQLAVLRYVSE